MSDAPIAAVSQMMKREVRALARVRHPNVVKLYGVCVEPVPMVLMALAPAGTLQDALDANRFDGNAAVTRLLLYLIAAVRRCQALSGAVRCCQTVRLSRLSGCH